MWMVRAGETANLIVALVGQFVQSTTKYLHSAVTNLNDKWGQND